MEYNIFTDGLFVQLRDIQQREWSFSVHYISNIVEDHVSYDVQLSPAGHFKISKEAGKELLPWWRQWINRYRGKI